MKKSGRDHRGTGKGVAEGRSSCARAESRQSLTWTKMRAVPVEDVEAHTRRTNVQHLVSPAIIVAKRIIIQSLYSCRDTVTMKKFIQWKKRLMNYLWTVYSEMMM